MITINFVEDENKYYLVNIVFESLVEVQRYCARWFPCDDTLLVQVASRKKDQKGEEKCNTN